MNTAVVARRDAGVDMFAGVGASMASTGAVVQEGEGAAGSEDCSHARAGEGERLDDVGKVDTEAQGWIVVGVGNVRILSQSSSRSVM